MLPLSLFHSSVVSASCIVGLLTNFSYYGLMFVLSLFFQATKGYSPLMTGLAFLPMTALVTVANLISGRLTARFGPRLPMVMGQALAACGYLTLAGIDGRTPYSAIVGPLLTAGIGVALTVPAMTAAVLASADGQRAGITSGALNAARQTGGVIGVGVFGSLVAGGPERLIAGMHVSLILAGLALGIGTIVGFVGVRVLSIGKSAFPP
jgi:DHA2 family methylenomycin A resistance protein-like MFS transporter